MYKIDVGSGCFNMIRRKDKSADKPGSVVDNHSSGITVTNDPQATNPKAVRAAP
jgi:hypothetical protein